MLGQEPSILNFYPPALTSGNIVTFGVNVKLVFLSTRSYERELALHDLGPVIVFLSTRSYERERFFVTSFSVSPISIHPLLRAGTEAFADTMHGVHFYPPALTSGN